MTQIKTWAAMASGTGTILDYLIEDGLKPNLVVVDQECLAAEKARKRGVKVVVMPRRGKFDPIRGTCDAERVNYTLSVVELLVQEDIDLVAMVGWMTVFSPEMFDPDRFGGRVLNTHPALLPAFRGAHAVPDALEFGVKITGCTIHIATEELDNGPILAQSPVQVKAFDTEELLHERIKEKERPAYADVVRAILYGSTNPVKIYEKWLAKQASKDPE